MKKYILLLAITALFACKKDDIPKVGPHPKINSEDSIGSVTFQQTTWNFICFYETWGQPFYINIKQEVGIAYKLTQAMNDVYFDSHTIIYDPFTFDSLSPGTYYFKATSSLVQNSSVCDTTFTGSITISEFDIKAGENTIVIIP